MLDHVCPRCGRVLENEVCSYCTRLYISNLEYNKGRAKRMARPCGCCNGGTLRLTDYDGNSVTCFKCHGSGIEYYDPADEIKEQESETGCFIATACYGSPDNPEVLALRAFRDKVLLSSRFGKFLVSIYYCYSPRLAAWLSSRPICRLIVRRLLVDPFVCIARIVCE